MSEPLTTEAIREFATQAILASTSEVLSTMLGLEATPGEVMVTVSAPSPTEGVVSVIGLAGPLQGTGIVSCGASMACSLAAAMLMGEYTTVNDEVLDAMAELNNMVIGNVKTSLEEKVGPMGLSIPTVIYGRNFSTKSIGNHEWTVIPFKCAGGTFTVQLCLIQRSEGKTPVRFGLTTPAMASM
jgi:chemotaxis protein CheX